MGRSQYLKEKNCINNSKPHYCPFVSGIWKQLRDITDFVNQCFYYPEYYTWEATEAITSQASVKTKESQLYLVSTRTHPFRSFPQIQGIWISLTDIDLQFGVSLFTDFNISIMFLQRLKTLISFLLEKSRQEAERIHEEKG